MNFDIVTIMKRIASLEIGKASKIHTHPNSGGVLTDAQAIDLTDGGSTTLHSHTGGGGGDMYKSTYDPNTDGYIAEAQLSLAYSTHSNSNDHAPGSDNQDLSGKENVGVAAGLITTHAGVITGVHGLAITTAKVITATDNTTLGGGSHSGTNTGDASGHSGLQVTLVNQTNIKSVNGSTLLGSGDLVVSGSVPDTILANKIPTEIASIATDKQISVFTSNYQITGTNALTINGTGRLRIF